VSVTVDLSRRLVAEALGTGLLVTAVVGSGVMAEQLAGGNVAVALLANTIATGGALVALIHTFGPVSGAHFNPAVTLADAVLGALPARDAGAYAVVQVAGGIVGAVAADAMFDLPLVAWSRHARTGPGQWLGEFLDRRRLLVHVVDLVRQPGSHDGPMNFIRPERPVPVRRANSAAEPDGRWPRASRASGSATRCASSRRAASRRGSTPTRSRALAEVGIDASGQHSKQRRHHRAQSVDLVITLCAEESCPVFLGSAPRMSWAMPDPDRKHEELSRRAAAAALPRRARRDRQAPRGPRGPAGRPGAAGAHRVPRQHPGARPRGERRGSTRGCWASSPRTGPTAT
jgi:protein-tyrosine-phosphatase